MKLLDKVKNSSFGKKVVGLGVTVICSSSLMAADFTQTDMSSLKSFLTKVNTTYSQYYVMGFFAAGIFFVYATLKEYLEKKEIDFKSLIMAIIGFAMSAGGFNSLVNLILSKLS